MTDKEEAPYCQAQSTGLECGVSVKEWGEQCEYHDPKGITRNPTPQTPIDILQQLCTDVGEAYDTHVVEANDLEAYQNAYDNLFTKALSAIYNLLAKEAVELYGPNPNAETVLAIKAVPLDKVRELLK